MCQGGVDHPLEIGQIVGMSQDVDFRGDDEMTVIVDGRHDG